VSTWHLPSVAKLNQ